MIGQLAMDASISVAASMLDENGPDQFADALVLELGWRRLGGGVIIAAAGKLQCCADRANPHATVVVNALDHFVRFRRVQ
ncbi:MAG: hypothetical protein AAF585_04650 [Verrucomicrobiota bacterium]